MKNKKILFIIIGIIIALIVSIVSIILIFSNSDVEVDIAVKLEKAWNLSHGDEITPDMYKDEKMGFLEDNGDNSFVSIDKNNDGYVLVGTNGKVFEDQGIIEYYDLNGKIKWTKKYPNIDSNNWKVTSRFEDVLAVKDGFIVIGTEGGNVYELGDSYYNDIIIKYDLNGNLVWSKKYNTPLSTANLDDDLSYDLIDIINLDEKYYIIGNLIDHLITQDEKKVSFNKSKQYGFIIELDSNGNEISFNKYIDGSNFFSAKVVDNKITINSLLGYGTVTTDSGFYDTSEGLGLIVFDGNSFNQIIKYVESDEESGVLFEEYRNFEYLDGVYYFVDPTHTGKILAIDKDGNEKFNIWAEDGDKLENYWLQDITTDGKNIYVYAYYYDMDESSKMTDSAIIIFDKEGNYKIVDIDEQYYYQIMYKDNSLLLPGSENSFAKYIIK